MCNKHHHEHGHCHDNEGGCGCGCHHHHEENEAPMWRALLPMAVAALLLIVGIVANPLPAWPWAVFVLAYLPVGLPILKEAGEEIAKGDIFNEFTLMVLATVGAFAIGEYPEAVAVLLFYSVGEYFQDRAVGRARRDIQSLVNLRPDTATVIDHDGQRTNVKPDAVEVGSVIEVVAGERVPLDGTLLTERADFDTAALTGEAEPRSIDAGDEVAAGMIAIGRVVRVRVLRPLCQECLATHHDDGGGRCFAQVARRDVYPPLCTCVHACGYCARGLDCACAATAGGGHGVGRVAVPRPGVSGYFVSVCLGGECAAGLLQGHRGGLAHGHSVQGGQLP